MAEATKLKSDASDAPAGLQLPDYAALALVVVLAGAMLFWRLGDRALWQDEAATAVLAHQRL